MYNFIILMVLVIFNSCGRDKTNSSKHDTQYWDDKRWYNFDDDKDGHTNEEELKNGTNPEIINAPDFSGFTLVDVTLISKLQDSYALKEPLVFETSSMPFFQYYYQSTSKDFLKGKYFFERQYFKSEHLVIQTPQPPPSPNVFILQPQINKGLASINKTFFYENLRAENKILNEELFSLKLTLNFPTTLQEGPYTKIHGEIKVGDKRIPWEWSKHDVTQVHWQIDIEAGLLEKLLTFREFITLHVLNWEILQPFGRKKFDIGSMADFRSFYILSSKGIEAGWYDEKEILPVEKIISRPTLAQSSLPWSFIKLEPQNDYLPSYWLVEHSAPNNMTWKLFLSDEDQQNLSLPPSPQVRGLKISGKTVLDIGTRDMEPRYHEIEKICYVTYPGLLEKRKLGETNRILIKNIAENFIINGNKLGDSLGSIYTITYEKKGESSAPTSITLYWPRSFHWYNFSIRGLKHDTFSIKLDNPGKCRNENTYSTIFPNYISRDFTFEWIL